MFWTLSCLNLLSACCFWQDGSAEGIAVEPVDEDVKDPLDFTHCRLFLPSLLSGNTTLQDQDKLLGQMLFGRSEVDAGYIVTRQPWTDGLRGLSLCCLLI